MSAAQPSSTGQSSASPAARRKHGGPTSVKSIVWAIALNLGIVMILVLFTMTRGDGTVEKPEVDVAKTAAEAAPVAGFPVASPDLGEQWKPSLARYSGGQSPQWRIAYATPSGKYADLRQSSETSVVAMGATLSGMSKTGEETIAGLNCEVFAAPAEDSEVGSGPRTAFSCAAQDFGITVAGTAEAAELQELAQAAIRSAQSS